MPDEVVPGSGGQSVFATLLSTNDRLSDRMRKVLVSALVAKASWATAKSVVAQVRSRLTYTVAVDATDSIYPALHRWLVENIPDERRRALTLSSGWNRNGRGDTLEVGPAGSAKRQATVDLMYDGSRVHDVELDGYRVKVSVEREGPASRSLEEARDMARYFGERERVVFTTYGPEARDAVIAFLTGLAEAQAKRERQPNFWIAARWGDWMSRSEIGKRSLSSVVLRAGQAERLVDDLTAFLASEADYLRLGMPWHRGYLLHGPPGTGKTSVAAALANHFDLDLYWLPLSDIDKDANLIGLVSAVRPGSMLLLEDIDVLHAATSRDDDKAGVTLSGLLNALDGVGTPWGLTTVMTTNRLEVLDEALVRPGRVDRREEIGYLDNDQLGRLVAALASDGVFWHADGIDVESLQIAPAEVVEIIKRHLGDPQAAVEAISKMLAEERVHG